MVDIESVTVALTNHKLQELLTLMDILSAQRRIVQKELDRLVGKLRSMYLMVPGVVAHLYYIQRTLAHEGDDRAWLLPYFHQ